MNETPAQQNNTNQVELDETTANLDKVRDILFGQKIREGEKRFGRLEERLMKEVVAIRGELQQNLDTFEEFARRELAQLSDRLATEVDERQTNDKQTSRELAELSKAVDEKLAKADAQNGKGLRDLREQLLEQSNKLRTEMRQRCEELAVEFNRDVGELRVTKADRAFLATILAEVAVRLRSDEALSD